MIHTSNSKASDWKVGIVINDQTVIFKMDTGAQCNVISKQTYDYLCAKPLHSSSTKLVSFGGQHLEACGKTTILCQQKSQCYSIEFEVVDKAVPNILGLHTCTEMNLIQRNDAVEHHTDLKDSYSDVFEGLGCITNVIHHINVDTTCQPVVHPPRKVTVILRPKIQQELACMGQLEVI